MNKQFHTILQLRSYFACLETINGINILAEQLAHGIQMPQAARMNKIAAWISLMSQNNGLFLGAIRKANDVLI